jgi:hypothetical protein
VFETNDEQSVVHGALDRAACENNIVRRGTVNAVVRRAVEPMG